MTEGLTQRQRHQAEVQAYRVGRFSASGEILTAVSDVTGLSVWKILNSPKSHAESRARWLYMLYARRVQNRTLEDIGGALHRTPSTVFNGVNRAHDLCIIDSDFRAQYDAVKALL
jgi:chromosomal replication initiation ATPase DnaA